MTTVSLKPSLTRPLRVFLVATAAFTLAAQMLINTYVAPRFLALWNDVILPTDPRFPSVTSVFFGNPAVRWVLACVGLILVLYVLLGRGPRLLLTVAGLIFLTLVLIMEMVALYAPLYVIK